jgi:hypothetical protein
LGGWKLCPTGATSVVGTSGATFYITGVQLEKGSTATSFDYRPYGTELALCQRYFNIYSSSDAQFPIGIAGSTTTVNRYTIPTPVTMRATPTVATSGTLVVYTTMLQLQNVTSIATIKILANFVSFDITVDIGAYTIQTVHVAYPRHNPFVNFGVINV